MHDSWRYSEHSVPRRHDHHHHLSVKEVYPMKPISKHSNLVKQDPLHTSQTYGGYTCVSTPYRRSRKLFANMVLQHIKWLDGVRYMFNTGRPEYTTVSPHPPVPPFSWRCCHLGLNAQIPSPRWMLRVLFAFHDSLSTQSLSSHALAHTG